MGQLYADFKAANCEIVLILGESLDKAKSYAERLHLPFTVLSDPERKIYHQYGLEKAMIFIQRTASMVIDQEGIIRYLKTTTSPMLWMEEYRELLGVVKSLGSGSG